MSEHAIYSPSGAKKWMTCAGSIALEDQEPGDCNEYTDQGTAAHQLASMCLKEQSHPMAYLERVLEVVNGVYWPGGDAPKPPKLKGHFANIERKFTVDADMVHHVNVYVTRLEEYAERGELLVEERVPVGHITGEEGAAGTADGIVILPDANTLEMQVHDLKYGMGVKVFAKENHQGMMYLLGALAKFEVVYGRPSKFRFVIHQPRLDHLDEWACSYDDLMAFAAKAKAAADVARKAFETRAAWRGTIAKGILVPGDHCKSAFCKARATCPALARWVQDVIGAEFEVLAADDGQPHSVMPADLTLLGKAFACVDLIQDWCKQVRAKAEAILFETHNAVETQQALGIKLVAGKKGNRQWTDEAEVEALLKKTFRMKTAEVYDLSLKSPTVITKSLKDEPKRLAKVTPLIMQKDGQPSVAPLSDSREALILKPVADDFAVSAPISLSDLA